jgi:hypothetical protein
LLSIHRDAAVIAAATAVSFARTQPVTVTKKQYGHSR